jgi:hypothetical protein
MKRIVKFGIYSGIAMWIALFIGGAIFAKIFYGPEMAPKGKFNESQMNAFYFIRTKLVIGIFFGILFTAVCEALSFSKKMIGALQGLKYSIFFWLIISPWNISHPLVYESINYTHQMFWLFYTLAGFLGFGSTLGFLYKKSALKT